jgi:transposase
MSEYIAFDSHKRYTWVDREDHSGGKHHGHRLEHAPGAVRAYLSACQPGTAVAVEATGNWYWIINEIDQAGMQPYLVHPRKAKLMMGLTHKTDKLDAQGLNRLQRNGTLPTVWIPPGPLRDLRELTRTRLVLVAQRTWLKNRLSATLANVQPTFAAVKT